MGYDEYKIPKTQHTIDWNDTIANIILGIIVLVLIGVIGFLIWLAVTAVDTKVFEKRLDNNCLVITYEENSSFGADYHNSGIYCKVLDTHGSEE